MATAKTPAVRKATGVAKYEDRLAALAAQTVEQEASVSSGSFISFKNGRMSYQGNTIKGDELDVIVLDSVLENCYYGEEKYDPENPAPPICYAFGRSEEEMVPHEKSGQPQASKCSECEFNKFGSADGGTGKGKACKNVRRLAVIPADAETVDAVVNAEVAYAKLPVTSVKGWATYVRGLATLEKLPPMAVVTTIGTVPDDKSQFKVTFQKSQNVDPELMDAVLDRHDAMKTEIMFPYPDAAPVAEKKPTKGAKAPAKRKF